MEINMVINTSGENGKSGQPGIDGVQYGSPQQKGSDGQKGQNAKPVEIILSLQEDTDQEYLIEGYAGAQIKKYQQLNQNFQIIANGGQGGNGGSGGIGNIGGSGGNAGNGGHGGHVNIKVHSLDLDLLMAIQSVENKGGKAGSKGKGGLGRASGKEHQRGSNYYQTVQRDGYIFFFFIQKVENPLSHLQTKHQTKLDYWNGTNGSDGLLGLDGIDGEFWMIVQDLGVQSPYRYDLIIKKSSIPISQDNVYEPGEKLSIDQIILFNEGGLPTPHKFGISVGIQTNQFIEFNSDQEEGLIIETIHPNDQYSLQEKLPFKIQFVQQACINQPLRVNAIIQFYARVNRINRFLSQIPDYQTILPIKYPVEFSQLVYQESIQIKEEAPLAIGIKNNSTLPIGEIYGRVLKVVLVHEEGSDQITWIPENNETFIPYNDQSFQQQEFLLQLLPGQILNISGSLQFTNQNLPLYTKSSLKFQLILGQIDRPLEDQVIQEMKMHIQLIDIFNFNDKSEFLLVINSETSTSIIKEIQNFAKQLETTCLVWNASYYQGFSYKHIVQKGLSIESLMTDKIVIIINNLYKNHEGQQIYLLDQMGFQTIFNAAQNYSVATYILNQNNLEQNFLNRLFLPIQPYQQRIILNDDSIFNNIQKDESRQQNNQDLEYHPLEKDQLKDFSNNDKELFIVQTPIKVTFSNPSESSMKQKSEEIQQKLNLMFPTTQYTINYNYKALILKKNCFSTNFSLGSLQVRRGLSKNRSFIATRRYENNYLSNLLDDDKYVLFKLFPMSKKVQFFNIIQQEEIRILLSEAIVSDLLQESLCFINAEQYNFQKVQTLMKNFNIFETLEINIGIEFGYLVNKLIKLNSQLLSLLTFRNKYICCFGSKKTFINWICRRIQQKHRRLLRIIGKFFKNIKKKKKNETSNQPHNNHVYNDRISSQLYFNSDLKIDPFKNFEDYQVSAIPLQNIKQNEFQFYQNLFGYQPILRKNVLNEFQNKIVYFK